MSNGSERFGKKIRTLRKGQEYFGKKKKKRELFPEGHKIFEGGKYIQDKSGMFKRNPEYRRPPTRLRSKSIPLDKGLIDRRYKSGGKTKHRHSGGLEQHD